MEQDNVGALDRAIVLLEQRRQEELKELLATLHPADLAEVLEELEDEQRAHVLHLLTDEEAAETLSEMEVEDQASILESVGLDRASDILEEMSADDAADLVAELSPQTAGELLQRMDLEEASDVRELLEYRQDTAGGIMTTEFIALVDNLTAQQAIDEMRRLAPDAETAYYVYVVGSRGELEGVLSLRELIVASPDRPIHEIMRTQVRSVNVNLDQEEVARIVKKYNMLAIPVVDDDGVLRGIVTVDDIIDVLEREATEDIYRAASVGGREEQDLESGVWPAVKARLPWLISLLFLSMLSGTVIDYFSDVLTSVVALSVFITTLAGGAGNAATQALAVVVRGLATGEIEREQLWAIVWRELKVGLIVGAAAGVVLTIIATFWQGSIWVGVIAGTAIFVNLSIAKVTGAFVPFVITRFGLDPAVASGPFITTVTDTVSMLVYFSIATAVLTSVSAI